MRRSTASDSTSLPNVRRIPVITGLALWGALAIGAVCHAQGENFITPGSTGRSAGIPDKDRLEEQIEQAPWDTGIFHFSPWLGIRDASVVTGTNVGDGTDETDDFTVTAGAGIRGYLRSGPKVVIAGHLLPEYTWWADDEDRRRLNGRYGLGLFAYLNRVELELSHRLVEEQGFFTSEVRRLTPTRNALTRAIFDVRIRSRLYVTLRASRTTAESVEDDSPLTPFLAQLDRTEERLQGLVGYRAPGGWRFAVGYEDTAIEFDDDARPLSNDETALLVESRFSGNRFDGLVEVAFRDLEPAGASAVRAASEVTGVVEGIWGLSPKSALLTYGRRSLTYSVSGNAAYFVGDRYGARWQGVFNRFGLGLWAETGEDRFESLAGAMLERTDDVTSFGAEASIALKAVRLQISLVSSDYSSPVDAFDRDVTTIGFSLQLEPLERVLRNATDRLRIGDAGSTW